MKISCKFILGTFFHISTITSDIKYYDKSVVEKLKGQKYEDLLDAHPLLYVTLKVPTWEQT